MVGTAVSFGLHLWGADPSGAARWAEELGFDAVAVDRDVLAGPPGPEVWTALTWVAARTARVRVVPNVLVLANRHPALVAKMAETVDRLSGGRLILALGAGAASNDGVAGALGLHLGGLAPAERVAATEEAIDVLRGLWSGQAFTYAGTWFRIGGAEVRPAPVRPIPLWLGAYGPRMLDLAGRKADGWVPSLWALDPDSAYRGLERVRAAASRAGRNPGALTYAYNLGILVEERANPGPGQVAGPPELVAKRLAAFARHGFTHLSLWPGGDTDEQLARQIELLADQVIPAVHALVG